MKKVAVCATVLFAASVTFAEKSPTFEWACNPGGNGFGNAITVDCKGNVYTTGYFSGTGDFDPGAGSCILTATPDRERNAFIQKLDASGKLVWAGRIGNAQTEGWHIAVDKAGNVYAAGSFRGTIDMDPGPDSFFLTSSEHAYGTSYLVKLNACGKFVWAKSFGASAQSTGSFDCVSITALELDSEENLIVYGGMSGNVSFDPERKDCQLSATGNATMYILKMDGSGSVQWIKTTHGATRGMCAFAMDCSGNFIISADDTLEKMASSGNFLWKKSIGNDSLKTLCVDGKGNIYGVGGAVHKFNPSGAAVWVKALGGMVEDVNTTMAVDDDGDIYVTGSFYGPTADFDPDSKAGVLTSNGTMDIFILKLNSDGKFVWAQGFGGESYYDDGRSIAVDNKGNLYATGCFAGTSNFDPGKKPYTLTSNGMCPFVLKWSEAVHSDNVSKPFSIRDAHTDYAANRNCGKAAFVNPLGRMVMLSGARSNKGFLPAIQERNVAGGMYIRVKK